MRTELKFTPVDVQTWDRREVYYYFSTVAPTGYSLTVELDITNMRQKLRAAGRKFYPAYLWLVTKLFNEQREFRTAKQEEQVGFYNVLTPLYAVFHEDNKTFSLMWTEWDDDFDAFYDAYLRDQEQYGGNHGILAKAGQLPPSNAYTVSCVPWISFQHFAVHSYDKPYFLPSVEAGRFYERDGRIWLPLSVTCHHATTDGWHVSRFLERFQEEADAWN